MRLSSICAVHYNDYLSWIVHFVSFTQSFALFPKCDRMLYVIFCCHFHFHEYISFRMVSLDSARVCKCGAGTKSDRIFARTRTHAQYTCAFTQLFIIYNQRIPIFLFLFFLKKNLSDSGNNTTINILNLLRPHSTELMAVSFMLSLYFIYIYWSGGAAIVVSVVVIFVIVSLSVCVCFFSSPVALHYERCPPWTLSMHIAALLIHILTHFRYKHIVFFVFMNKKKLYTMATEIHFGQCISMNVIITCIYAMF